MQQSSVWNKTGGCHFIGPSSPLISEILDICCNFDKYILKADQVGGSRCKGMSSANKGVSTARQHSQFGQIYILKFLQIHFAISTNT